MRHYYFVLAAYIIIFTASNAIVLFVTYLFAAISKAVLRMTVKRVEMDPVELTYAEIKEFPDDLTAFIAKKTKSFKKVSVLYFAIIELIDVVFLFVFKDAVFPCRLSIGLMFASLVVLGFMANRYLKDVVALNEKVNEEIEFIKAECAQKRKEELEGKKAKIFEENMENEIADGKAFLNDVVQNQLINEKLPDDFC